MPADSSVATAPQHNNARQVFRSARLAAGHGMAFNFFRRQLNERERAVADRLPPGQYLTQKWPVLHYGGIPKIDLATWDFVVDGLLEEPLRLTYAEFKALPRQTVKADVHCVTRWSLLDSTWEGVAINELMRRVKLKPEATHVMVR